MLHYGFYRDFCMGFIGKVINHDDTIEEKHLKYFAKETKSAWEARDQKRKEAEKEFLAEQLASNALAAKKRNGLKSKIKSIFGKKGRDKVTVSTTGSPTLPIPVPKRATNGYSDVEVLFAGKYNKGTYEVPVCGCNPPKKADHSLQEKVDNEVEDNLLKDDTSTENDETMNTVSDVASNSENNGSSPANEKYVASGYDETNVSFHDRSNY